MAVINKNKLKTAVIGCGRIGAFTRDELIKMTPKCYFPINHCAAVSAVSELNLVAVCDTNLESAEKAAKFYKVKNFYTDFKKLIREENPDIITIATRTDARIEIINFASRHGVKGIYIEKPLARSLKEAKAAIKAIEKNNIACAYGTIRRYMGVYRQAKDILSSGIFGKLEQIIIEFGKTMLMWTHPHSIDLICFFADDKDVNYVQSYFEFNNSEIKGNCVDKDPVLDSGIVKFKNGISGMITCASGKNVKLICEKGEIQVNNNGKDLLTIDQNGNVKNIKIKKGVSGICQALREISENIREGKTLSLDAQKILSEQKILLGLGYSGINNGKKIRLEDVEDNFTITGRINNLFP